MRCFLTNVLGRGKLMRIPTDEPGNLRTWTLAAANDALLYFVQLVDEHVNFQSTDAFRAVSLDSYHRLMELDRTWEEAIAGGFNLDLADQVGELLYYLGRDPIITKDNSETWDAIGPRLRSASDRPLEAIEAVKFISSRIRDNYLRQCRDYISANVQKEKAKDKRDFRFVVENFCSYLMNIGYGPESIYFRLKNLFFDREISASQKRELEDFFSFFPHKQRTEHMVGFAVTKDLDTVLSKRADFSKVTAKHVIKVRPNTFSKTPVGAVYAWKTTALDSVDARSKGESYLTLLRSVAYTVMPYANMAWDSNVVVVDDKGYSVVLREQLDRMRQGRWSPRNRTADLEKSIQFFLNNDRAPGDRNRLLNAVNSYASAFHSESHASQLLSLWTCLEGILPAPSGTGSRISSFARDVRAAHMRLYFAKNLGAVDYDLYGVHREVYSNLMANVVSENQDPISKLVAMMCFATNSNLHTEVGTMCATNPLGRQRLFELYIAGKSAKSLYALAFEAGRKVDWQLRRIYRERNRIAHRASPSENIETLIQTLNSYVLMIFETLIRVAEGSPTMRQLDEIFAEVRITEEARDRRVTALGDAALTVENVGAVLGPER